MIIGEQETWTLEDLTCRLDKHNKWHKRSPPRIPLPPDEFSAEDKLGLVNYLQELTKSLIKMKKEDLARNVRLEDGDFLYDLGSYTHPDLQKKGRFWRQFQEFVRSLHDMTWPEACLKILRRFHVEVTPIELIDSFKNFLQASKMSDEDYILLMHSRAMGLSSVLPMKDALLFTVANLNDCRVKLPLDTWFPLAFGHHHRRRRDGGCD